jgi:hypothetical protein
MCGQQPPARRVLNAGQRARLGIVLYEDVVSRVVLPGDIDVVYEDVVSRVVLPGSLEVE